MFIILENTLLGDNMDNKSKKKNAKKHDGKFKSKNIKHNPQAESARAVFGKTEMSQGDQDIEQWKE